MGAKINVYPERTAITRKSISKPLRLLAEKGVLTQDTTLLDFGCGRGDDVRFLVQSGYMCWGWDPYYYPSIYGLEPADIVYLGYVLNTIPDQDERDWVLTTAFLKAHMGILVAVRTLTDFDKKASRKWTKFNDGWITTRQTFQKYYKPGELYEQVLRCIHVSNMSAFAGVDFPDGMVYVRFNPRAGRARYYDRVTRPKAPVIPTRKIKA